MARRPMPLRRSHAGMLRLAGACAKKGTLGAACKGCMLAWAAPCAQCPSKAPARGDRGMAQKKPPGPASHREEQDAAAEVEHVEGDVPAVGAPGRADELVHAGLAEQRQRLEQDQHAHERVQPVRVRPLAQQQRAPQRRHHR